MVGGVNRFEGESAPTQAAEALDAVNSEGKVRRRGGMTTFATGAPHHLPAGAVNVIAYASSYSNLTNRAGSISSNSVFYVGCGEQFDGIDWPGSALPANAAAVPDDTYYLEAHYWNGSAWTAIPFIHDTTQCRPIRTDGGDDLTAAQRHVSLSLSQHGHISWHTEEHLANWATTEVNSITRYYVRLSLMAAGSSVTAKSGTTINQPGVRVFKLAPVNGLFPVKLKDRAVLVVGTDRSGRGGAIRRGVEFGAQLGLHTNERAKIETSMLVADEGAATIGQFTHVGWDGSGTWNTGTTGELEKTKKTFLDADTIERDYKWLYDPSEPKQGQFLGAIIAENLLKTDTPTATLVKLVDADGDAVAEDYENCRLRITSRTSGSSNPQVGEEREIVSYDSTNGYTVYPAFSGAPAAEHRFAVYRPHAVVRFDTDRDDGFSSGVSVTHNWEVGSHTDHTITPVAAATNPYAELADLTAQFVNFEVGRELRWTTPGGERWCGAYDSVTGKLILANGECPLLTFDGRRLRVLEADDSSDSARDLAGELAINWSIAEAGSNIAANATANAMFRPAPPIGAYVVDYMGRIVVADPKTNIVAYSMPNLANDIWPYGYEVKIRDDENSTITGLATLYDQLLVFTSTAIFATAPAGQFGQFAFNRVAHGVGFVSHHSVQKIAAGGSSAIIGAGTDGVYMFNGTDPVPVLDDWKRLLPEGVNRSGMKNACATASFVENKYYLAVPSAGSNKNDRILVFDWLRKQWWVFSAPYGAASLATDLDENGKERVLVGTYDGHVAEFTNHDTDDGTAITATAKSPAFSPLGRTGQEASFIALTLDMKNLGTNTVTISTYTNRQTRSRESSSGLAKTLKVDAGLDVWGTGTWNNATWGDHRTKTVRLNMPTSARGSQIQYEISGSGSWELNSAVLFARPMGPRGRR